MSAHCFSPARLFWGFVFPNPNDPLQLMWPHLILTLLNAWLKAFQIYFSWCTSDKSGKGRASVCLGPKVCVLPSCACWNPDPQGDGLRRWGLWGDEVMRVGPSWVRLVPWEKGHQRTPCPSRRVRTQQEDGRLGAKFQNGEDKFLLFISLRSTALCYVA